MKVVMLGSLEYLLLVDNEDFHLVVGQKWYAVRKHRTFYAQKNVYVEDQRTVVQLHTLILTVKPGFFVDHVNGDGLDCRRQNLREATGHQNAHNARRRTDNTSGHKGVSWNKRVGRWQGYVSFNKKIHHVGYFNDVEVAAQAVAVVRKQLHEGYTNHGY